jgi:hypothetical protein
MNKKRNEEKRWRGYEEEEETRTVEQKKQRRQKKDWRWPKCEGKAKGRRRLCATGIATSKDGCISVLCYHYSSKFSFPPSSCSSFFLLTSFLP